MCSCLVFYFKTQRRQKIRFDWTIKRWHQKSNTPSVQTDHAACVCVCLCTPEVLGSSFGRSFLPITTDVLSCWWIVSQNKTSPYINSDQSFWTIGLFSPTFPNRMKKGQINQRNLCGLGFRRISEFQKNVFKFKSVRLPQDDWQKLPWTRLSTYHSFSSFVPFSKWSK